MWSFLKKLAIELPYDPAIPLLGIHTKKTRTERDVYPMFIAALFIIARSWKHGEGNGNPLQYSCLENPMDGGAW